MVFSSTVFLCIYLPIVLGLYYICPEKLKNGFLLFASLVFYAWGEPVYVLLMMFSIAVNYFFGLLMEKKSGKKKLWLVISVIVDLGLLCFFKYTDFVIENLNSAFDAGFDLLKLALPIGISFYTFQNMSYPVDVYRGDARSQRQSLGGLCGHGRGEHPVRLPDRPPGPGHPIHQAGLPGQGRQRPDRGKGKLAENQ